MVIAPIAATPIHVAALPAEPPQPFSTHIDGKNYPAEVVRSGGQYVARDPQIPGAEASGPSTQAQEALSNRIDCLV